MNIEEIYSIEDERAVTEKERDLIEDEGDLIENERDLNENESNLIKNGKLTGPKKFVNFRLICHSGSPSKGYITKPCSAY